MLVVLTLLAVAGMRMSNSSLQVVGNMQARRFVDNVAAQAVEDVLNSIAPFNTPTGGVTLRSGGTTVIANPGVAVSLPSPAGIQVTVSSRACLFSAAAPNNSLVQPIVPEDNLWEFTVSVTDSFTQATTTMGQGTKIRQLAGSCL
jgi:hypothetical protein